MFSLASWLKLASPQPPGISNSQAPSLLQRVFGVIHTSDTLHFMLVCSAIQILKVTQIFSTSLIFPPFFLFLHCQGHISITNSEEQPWLSAASSPSPIQFSPQSQRYMHLTMQLVFCISNSTTPVAQQKTLLKFKLVRSSIHI